VDVAKVDGTTKVDEVAKVIALRIQQKTEKLPGRKKLERLAGCGEGIPCKVLNKWKKNRFSRNLRTEPDPF
jgi:hypothetical protein